VADHLLPLRVYGSYPFVAREVGMPPFNLSDVKRLRDESPKRRRFSGAVIVLEAREKGGTLNAGYCALQMKKPLFVTLYEDMNGGREGNQRLLQEGATPLRKSRTSGAAEIRHLLEAVDGPALDNARTS
jgi:predicted Rossmann fold nucleotide-binding protein DprA/Smf involved in DNA uptake